MARVTNGQRIMAALEARIGLDDDELAARLGISRQIVNQECRLLASRGLLIRGQSNERRKIVNYLPGRERSRLRDQTPEQNRHIEIAASLSVTPLVDITKPLQIGDIVFGLVCEIAPRRRSDGAIDAYLPQSQYHNAANLALNRYGAGPFCKFRIPANHTKAGVYIITVDSAPVYVGECVNLASRYNMGYGNISPRNCYRGGQETNCRVNKLIYDVATHGGVVHLWFLETERFKKVERDLRAKLRLPWNRV